MPSYGLYHELLCPHELAAGGVIDGRQSGLNFVGQGKVTGRFRVKMSNVDP